jgi:hypothetical protein
LGSFLNQKKFLNQKYFFGPSYKIFKTILSYFSGSRQDSCSADGYTTSIYTLSISSATFDNRRPWYLEECPSTIATTYSSANINQPAIVSFNFFGGILSKITVRLLFYGKFIFDFLMIFWC